MRGLHRSTVVCSCRQLSAIVCSSLRWTTDIYSGLYRSSDVEVSSVHEGSGGLPRSSTVLKVFGALHCSSALFSALQCSSVLLGALHWPSVVSSTLQCSVVFSSLQRSPEVISGLQCSPVLQRTRLRVTTSTASTASSLLASEVKARPHHRDMIVTRLVAMDTHLYTFASSLNNTRSER